MFKVSIFKGVKPNLRITTSTPEDIYQQIRSNVFADELTNHRLTCSINKNYSDNSDENGNSPYVEKLVPRVCFSGVFRNMKGEKRLLEMNPLILLEVNNLLNFEYASEVRSVYRLYHIF